jgi:hypothetical protein
MKIVDNLLKQFEQMASELTFSVVVQFMLVRFWKRMLLIALPLAWGLWDLFQSSYAFIREFSLELVISNHPYSALLSVISTLIFLTSRLPK